jgi:hypothetical protein
MIEAAIPEFVPPDSTIQLECQIFTLGRGSSSAPPSPVHIACTWLELAGTQLPGESLRTR